MFSGVLDRFPRLDLILAHLGAALPFILPRIDIETELNSQFLTDYSSPIEGAPSSRFLRFYLDTVSHHAAAYRCALETWGSERILLGSDYPYSRWERSVDAIEVLGLSQHDENLILSGNARRLLKLSSSPLA